METQGTVSPSNGSIKISRSDFPKEFFFGTATSAYQFEGAAKEDGKGPSIWDTFTQRHLDKILDGSNGNVAIDTYHQYKEDVKILKKLGLNAYRFSISWPRILPGGKLSGGVNKQGIKYYNDLIDELLANGIEPFVTLFHWDLPQALEDDYGGFLSSEIVPDFCDYVEVCFWEFGDRVKHWITLNEPWSYCVGGYIAGSFAPGRGASSEQHLHDDNPLSHRCICRRHYLCSDGDPSTEPYIVAHNQLLAHAAAVDLYRQKFQTCQKGKIGITLVSQWTEPLDETNELDVNAALRSLDFNFGWFMKPLTSGDYPESMKKLVGSRLPQFSAEESKLVKGSYDFLGLNYYTSSYATSATSSSSGPLSYFTDSQVTTLSDRNGQLIGPKAASGWLHVYPQGIQKLLVHIKEMYNDPLIYITENGIDEANNVQLPLSEARIDKMRVEYHRDHLYYLQKAIHDGVNVKGYFVWSFMDNFEWNEGYTVRFGIIHIDYNNTLTRYPKESAIWFMNFLEDAHHKLPSKRPVTENNEYGPTKKIRVN